VKNWTNKKMGKCRYDLMAAGGSDVHPRTGNEGQEGE